MAERKNLVKIIDYDFQKESQLTRAIDDSNTMLGLDSNKFNCYVVGRHSNSFSIHRVENYQVVFLPSHITKERFAEYIKEDLKPDIIHMHGNHGWSQYPYYASFFRQFVPKMIFSPAGSSCGTPDFLSNFDHIIVNHPLQVDRMKCNPSDREKIIVRRRAVSSEVFYPSYSPVVLYKFVYVAGFVPVKQIPTMIETIISLEENQSLVIIGDFTRISSHYNEIRKLISEKNAQDFIFLKDFMPQKDLVSFLGNCGIFVWPNIKPENPSTTTNRSVVEALGCGMPLLLGERAFRETEFVVPGANGFLYSDSVSFKEGSKKIFDNLDQFRQESVKLSKERFSYEQNFIRFYNDLYS